MNQIFKEIEDDLKQDFIPQPNLPQGLISGGSFRIGGGTPSKYSQRIIRYDPNNPNDPNYLEDPRKKQPNYPQGGSFRITGGSFRL